MTTREQWRLLPTDVGASSYHFALSDALVRLVAQPAIWWHATDRPTLILGTGQPWSDTQMERCRKGGVSVVRRQAGGTAVFATGRVLGLDVVLPRGHHMLGDDILEAYRWLGETWRQACSILGVQTELVTVEQARSQSARGPHGDTVRAACFGALSPYEVLHSGRKLIGLAQVRRRNGALMQSGIHLTFDARALASLLSPEADEEVAAALAAAAVGLEDVREDVDVGDVMAAFKHALKVLHGIDLVPSAWTAQELEHAGIIQGAPAGSGHP